MPKRFTDTDKWKKKWFRNLSITDKVFWLYLLDSCDHAGIWEVDFEFASIFIQGLDEDLARTTFKKQYHEFQDGRYWFIQNFIDFQYGELKENNNVHKSVLQRLKKQGLHKVLKRSLQGPKDKDKDKDKEKEKEYSEDFTVFWDATNKKGRKQEAFKSFTNRLKTHSLDDIKKAYNQMEQDKSDTELRYWPHVTTFLNSDFESYFDRANDPMVASGMTKAEWEVFGNE